VDVVRIPYCVIPVEPYLAVLDDGDYVIIRFKSFIRDHLGLTHPHPFPWLGVVIRSVGGSRRELFRATDLSEILRQVNIRKIFIIETEFSSQRLQELKEMIAA
jgi:hypothetical protein